MTLSCQRMGPTEISGQEALRTRNPLSTVTEQPGQRRWIRSSQEGACQAFPDVWANGWGEGELSVCVHGRGKVAVGSYIYSTSSLSFWSAPRSQAQRQAALQESELRKVRL